jgi:hypothetical protein
MVIKYSAQEGLVNSVSLRNFGAKGTRCRVKSWLSIYLSHSTLMTPPLRRGHKEEIYHLKGESHAYNPPTHDQNIGIIVLSAHSGSIEVVAKGCSYPLVAISHDTHPQACATDQNPPIEFTIGDCPSHIVGHLRVIGWIRAKHTHIPDTVIGQAFHMDLTGLF